MKKWIFTLTLSVLLAGFSQAQVIFDPATYSGALPAGMAKDTIGGTIYLRVIVNGWSSSIIIPEVAILAPSAKSTIKYSLGPDTDSTLHNANVNAGINLKDTVNKVEDQWNPGNMVASQTSLSSSPSDSLFGKVQGNFLDTMEYVHEIQFFGQVTQGGWPATVGDTIWVGKIVGFDATVMFDPATYDTSLLPEGMEIIEDGGAKYLKATLNEWNSQLPLGEDFSIGQNNKMYCITKLAVGTSGKPLDSLNMGVQPNHSVNTSVKFAAAADASATFDTMVTNTIMLEAVDQIQLYSQYKAGSWPAMVGAELYLGKIWIAFVEENSLPPQRTYVAAQRPSADAVTLDGINTEAAWDNADLDSGVVNRLALGTRDNEDDSYGELCAIWDEDYLYLYVQVTDQTPRPFPSASEEYWNNDGIEMFTDAKDRRFEGGRLDGQHQFRINLTREAYDMGPTNYASFPLEWEQLIVTTPKPGYNFEIKIPFATLFMSGTIDSVEALAEVDSKIKYGYRMSFELSILDADAADDTRESIINWANPTGEDKAYTTSQYYGQIQLGDTTGFVGIKEKAIINNVVRIIPNPAKDYFRIEGVNVVSYTLIDITGRLVSGGLYNPNKGISVSSLKTGVYVVRTIDAKGAAGVARFIKN